MNNAAKIKTSFSKYVVYSLILLLLLILQNTLALRLPNVCLILPAVIVISLNDDSNAGLVLGGVFGALWDITSGTVFGYNAFMMLVFAFAAQIATANLICVKWLTSTVTSVIFASIYQVVTYLFFFVIWGNGGAWYVIFVELLRLAVNTAVVSMVMFFIYRLIARHTRETV